MPTPFRASLLTCALALTFTAPLHAATLSDAAGDLGEADLSALMDVKVTSAAKRTERLATSSAAVTVITAEEPARLPVTRIEDVFRTVPGMTVSRVSGNRYAISTRGGNQQFAGNLLVMVDGRTVYSPVFAGVWWDAEEVPLDEIARIEIVRGPGATLWGVNAVNGVINIITKSAATTLGGLLNVGTGSVDRGNVYARYGLQLNEDGYARVYASRASRSATEMLGSGNANDATELERAGARYDQSFGDDRSLRVTTEVYRGMSRGADLNVPQATPLTFQQANTDMAPRGGHLLARYSMPAAGGQLHLQGSFSNEARYMQSFGLNYNGDSADIELQHDLDFDSHRLIWGLGLRRTRFEFNGSYPVQFAQRESSLHNNNLFVQDEMSFLDAKLKLTLGVKLENDNYTGTHALPTLRVLYAPDERHSWWGALSRANQTTSLGAQLATIRQGWIPAGVPNSPCVLSPITCSLETAAGPENKAGQVDSIELGHRSRLTETLAVDIAAFATRGKDLPSSELGTPQMRLAGFTPYLVIPIELGSLTRNRTRGVETSIDWQVRSDFRLRAGASWFAEDYDERTSALSLPDRTTGYARSTPNFSGFLRGSHDWDRLTADWTLRHVGRIEAYDLAAYTALDVRAAWMVDRSLDLILTLTGLGGGKRYESGATWFSVPTVIGPEWALNAKWRL